jgi:hypothetical protein
MLRKLRAAIDTTSCERYLQQAASCGQLREWMYLPLIYQPSRVLFWGKAAGSSVRSECLLFD